MASQSVEEYIEAVYRLGGEKKPVSTCDIADQLGVSPPSVTTMISRLSRDGLVHHVRYYGITLTEAGLKMASSILRRHRLSERLLTDVIGIPLERVHDTACKLEHVMTGELEEKAFSLLGEPERCPHGQLLTGPEDESIVRLSLIEAGHRVEVVKITCESEEFLRAARELGVLPGAAILVESVDECGARISSGGEAVFVEREFTDDVWVNPNTEE